MPKHFETLEFETLEMDQSKILSRFEVRLRWSRQFLFCFFVLSLFLTFLTARSAKAQTSEPRTVTTGPQIPITPDRLQPQHTETINYFNGQMRLNFPLHSITGRGGMSIPIFWRTNTSLAGYFYQDYDPDNPPELRNYISYGSVDEGYVISSTTKTTIYVGGMMAARTETVHDPSICGTEGCSNAPGAPLNMRFRNGKTLTTLTYTTPDGEAIELVDAMHMGSPLSPLGRCGQPGPSRGTVFVSTDGTGATFISDSEIRDPGFQTGLNYSGAVLSGYIKFNNGTVGRIENWRTVWMRDRNGNQLTFYYDPNIHEGTSTPAPHANPPIVTPFGRVIKIVDSLGRSIDFAYGVDDQDGQAPDYGFHDVISFQGFDEQTREIRITRKLLSDVLKPGQPLLTQLGIDTSLGGNGWFIHPSQANTPFNPLVVSTIWLPDGRQHKFLYNSYAEIARVELASGGGTEYDYAFTQPEGIPEIQPFTVDEGVKIIRRRLVEKREYPVAGNIWEKKVTVSQSHGIESGDKQYVDVTDHGSSGPISKQRHFYFGQAGLSFASRSMHFPSWKLGKEYKRETINPADEVVQERVETSWQQSGMVSWWSQITPIYASNTHYDPHFYPSGMTSYLRPSINYIPSPCFSNNPPSWTHLYPLWNGQPDDEPSMNPRIYEVKKTIEPSGANLVSKATYSYDQFNNITDTYEYDFGVGQAGGLLRRAHTDYLTINPINNEDYTQNDIHIRALPWETWLSSDSNGNNKVSFTRYEYDNYSFDSNHAPLTSRTNVTGHDSSNFGSNSVFRGNITAVTHFANAQNQTDPVTVYSQYDILGNLVKTIDAKGKASTISYDDNFGAPDGEARTNTPPTQLNGQNTFAFPTSSINALGWVTGYSQVDYFTGASVNTEDLNGVISKTIYNDPLGRPTQSVSAIGTAFERQSNIIYDDINRRIETKSDLFNLNDNLIKSESFYDGLGRTIETRSYKDAGYSTVKTEYDALSRVKQVSNPYRPHLSETAVWTKSKYDALGRSIEIETPDGAKVKTVFDGNRTLVIDQAGKQRISRTNALGQLKDVWEVTASDPATEAISFPNQTLSAGYRTSYSYDALSNLITVNQGVQTRTFAYNSLSRLLSATNPESGTINYVYDNNGNPTRKTDARGVQTDYVYDDLNRVTNRNYSTPGGIPPNYQATPNVTYTYDDPLIANSKGKLTKVASSVSTTEYVTFDILGRVTRSKQTTEGVVYGDDTNPMTYTYNLSGALIEQKYPSGRVVKNVLDGEGDLALVQSKKNATHGYWNYANSFTYNAAGAVISMQLGNGRWESTQFNSRLQPTQIALGTVQNGTDKLKLDYEYGALNLGTGSTIAGTNNGNVSKQTITVPTVGVNPGFVAAQYYAYDPLNRIQIATENITPESQTAQLSWRQQFTYDRYGNRNFDEANTTTLPKNCNGNTTVCPVDVPIVNPSVNTANNRLNGYQFDNAGNTTRDAESRKFNYDAENKQVKVETVDGSGNPINTVGEYFYDGDGKRIKKYVPSTGETTIFVYDAAGKLVAEYSTVVASQQDAKVACLTNDHLGSPRINTDKDGNVTARHDYHPFGEEIGTLYPPYNGSTHRTVNLGYTADNVRQKFTGYELDTETDLDFAQTRMYRNSLGRFSIADQYLPILLNIDEENSVAAEIKRAKFTAQPQNWSRYHYTVNNPLKYTDSSGQIPVLAVAGQAAKEVAKKALVGAAIGAVFGGGVEAAVQLYDHGRITDTNRIVSASGEGAIFGAFTGGAGPVSKAVGHQIAPRVIMGLVGSNIAGTGVRTVTGQETTTGDVLTDTLAGGLGSAAGSLVSGLKTQQARLYVGTTLERVVSKIPFTKGTHDGLRGFYIPMYSEYGDSYIGTAVRSGVKWVVEKAGGYGEVLGYQLDSPCAKESDSGKKSTPSCN